jgi:SAM-dependent methyltransferase
LAEGAPPDSEALRFFEEHWRKADPWGFDSSPYEQARLDRLRDVVADRRYGRVLELGCGAGHLTERLAPLAERVVALDVSPTAIEKARARIARLPAADHVDLRVADVMETDLGRDGPFDLVVLTETVYYLGWLYSFFKVAWLARTLQAATAPGGRLLLANTLGDIGDALLLPSIVRAYHDVFVRAGYEVEREDTIRGTKDGVDLEVLVSLLTRLRGD